MAVPACTPVAIVERVNAELVRALSTPGGQTWFESQGGEVVADSPEVFAQAVRAENARWREVIQESPYQGGIASAASPTLPLTRPGKVVSFRRRHTREKRMATSRTYVKSEVVGSSDKSVSDAIESAIATASRSLRNLEWFEVVDVRGSIRDNKVANYQVTLKLGLRYEPKA